MELRPSEAASLTFVLTEVPDAAPSGRIGVWSGTSVTTGLVGNTALVPLDGDDEVAPTVWSFNFTVPASPTEGAYVAFVSYLVGGQARYLTSHLEVRKHVLQADLDDISDIDEPTWYGTYTTGKIRQMWRYLYRLLIPNVTRSTPVMEQITVVSSTQTINTGNTPLIEFQVYEEEPPRLAVDLTGATVVYRAYNVNDPDTLVFEKTCTIVDPEVGGCQAQLLAADTDVVGLYTTTLIITLPDSTILTGQTFLLSIV